MWELGIGISDPVDREDLSWHHWDGAGKYVGGKNEVLRKESEQGDGTFAGRGKPLRNLGK